MKVFFSSLFSICTLSSFCQEKSSQLVPYRNGNLWGYSDKNKKIIIPPKFNEASVFGYLTNCCFYSDFAKVKLGSKSYLIDLKGKLIDEKKILMQDENEDGPSQMDGYTFTDSLDTDGSVISDGKLIVPSTFYQQIEIKPGYNKYFVATKNDKKGIIDRNDHIVLPFNFEYADYVLLKEYYDTQQNKMMTPCHFLVKENGDSLYHFVDIDGNRFNKIFFSKYKVLSNFIAFQQINSNGVALWGLMDRHLNVIVKPKYSDILKEEDYELFLVVPFSSQTKSKSLPGYINEKGIEFFK